MNYTLTHTILFFQVTIKEPLVPLTKNCFLLTLLCFASCNDAAENEIVNNIQIAKEKPVLDRNKEKRYYKNQVFSGNSVIYHSNGQLVGQVGYYKGKKEGLTQKWFENGILRKQSYYKGHRLRGTAKTWRLNGILNMESYWVNSQSNRVRKNKLRSYRGSDRSCRISP